MRVRNPWGNHTEWNGAWSDNSAEWKSVAEDVKQKMGVDFQPNGEYWMCFDDWMKHFSMLEVCNLTPDSLTAEQLLGGKKEWVMSTFDGEWKEGLTAGGSDVYEDSFWRNPQYIVTLDEPDDDDEDGLCTIIVALMEKYRRSRENAGSSYLEIGFNIYGVTKEDLKETPLSKQFFRKNKAVAQPAKFVHRREVISVHRTTRFFFLKCCFSFCERHWFVWFAFIDYLPFQTTIRSICHRSIDDRTQRSRHIFASCLH